MIGGMNADIKWPFFARMFSELLEKTGVSLYRLDEDTPLRAPNLSKIKKGVRRPTDDIIKELASYKPLGVSEAELKAWRLVDEMEPEILQQAIDLQKKKRGVE